MFLVAYSAYMFFRPAVAYLRDAQSRQRDAAVGFAGGLVGGLTAMPGVLPTIWCDLRGLAKEQQRGLVKPFIAATQCVALALLLTNNSLTTNVLLDLVIGLPALALGTALGLALLAGQVMWPTGGLCSASCLRGE